MTTTEDDLRGALRLLEQRAPEELPDIVDRPARRRASMVAIAAAAAVVLVVVGLGLFLGLRGGGRTPSPAGPPPVSRPPAVQRSTTEILSRTGLLHVRVTLSGGPVRPDGKQALDNSPQADVSVSVTSLPGSRGAYRTSLRITSTTNRQGVATFELPPGRYAYRWAESGCNPTGQKVTLRAGDVRSEQISCNVP